MAKKYDATAEEISFYESDAPDTIGNDAPTFEVQDEQIVFYENAQAQPLPENLPWYQSYPAAAGKALVNGAQNFLKGFGPLQTDGFPQKENTTDLRTFLDQQVPSNQGFIENTLERAGQILPFLLTGNPAGIAGTASNAVRGAVGGLAESAGYTSPALKDIIVRNGKELLGPTLRATLAGASGETAKEFGAPEWLQSLAEVPAQFAPGFGSRIKPNARQAPIVEEARRLGLNENQITPLIQSDRKTRVLSKLASRRGRAENALKDSYEAVGEVYGKLSSRVDAKKALSVPQANEVGAEIQKRLSTMPAGIRNQISEDLSDLLNSPITGENLINFFQDINYYVGNGERQLGLLKEPITTALAKVSPQLAMDFNSTNKLYQSYHKIASKLKPNIADDLISGSEGVRLLYGAFTGNYPLIVETVGEAAARQMSTELLVNPRFQNLSRQMVEALNNNKLSVAAKVYDSMLNLARDIDPESAAYLQRANFSSLGKSNRKEEGQ